MRLCLEGLEERLTPSGFNPIDNNSPALVGQANPNAATASPTTTTASNATASFNASDQTVSLSATVTSNSTPVTEGTVTFKVLQGTRLIGTATTANSFNSSGTATVSYSLPGGTSAGTYTIEADYTDSSGTFADSSDTAHTLTVSNTPAAAATVTKASAATATFSTSSQNVTLSATVKSNDTPVTVGTVQFTILQGSTVIGTAVTGTPGSDGTATATFSLPAGASAGIYTIEADYFDSTGAFQISSDNTQKLTVTASTATTTTTATTAFGSANVTLTANVTSPGGTVNEGTVTFTVKDSQGNTIGTATPSSVNSSGQASANYPLPAGTAAGSYTIDASYTDSVSSGGSGIFGDSNNSANPTTLTVSSVATTTTATGVNAVFSSSDQNVTLSASVAPTSGSGTVNEGTMAFTLVDNKGNTIGTEKSGTVSGGQASVSYVVPGGTAAGSYIIEADYSDSAGNFVSSSDHLKTLTIGASSATTLQLTGVTIDPNLTNSTAQVTLTAQVGNAAGTVNEGSLSITLGGVTGQGSVADGRASVQLSVPLGTVSNLANADLSYTDSGKSANFSDGSATALLTTNLWNALVPASLTFAPSGTVHNELSLGGNTSLFGFTYLTSGLLTEVIFDSLSLPVTYSTVGGNTVTTFLGSPTAITFRGSDGQVLGTAKVFYDGTQLQWILYNASNQPIGEVPYTGMLSGLI